MEWTADLAYAIGLITTDGYLSTDGRHFSLTSTDIQLLQTFKRCLGKTNSITRVTPSSISKKIVYRVQIGDVNLCRFFRSIGLTSNKSLTLKKLEINSKYLPDFLRGHLDGDGSIIHYKDTYNTYKNINYIYDRLFVCFLSCSEDHIRWIREEILLAKGLKGSISRHIPATQLGKAPCVRLKYSTREAKVLLNWLYYKQFLPCLKRKKSIAREYLEY